MSPKLKTFLLVSIASLVLDQATKIWVVQNLALHRDEIQVIPGFLSIIHAQNPNAAMGLGASLPTSVRFLVFGAFTVIALGVLLEMFRQLPRTDRLQSTTVGLIFSGAVGNAIDRIHKQSVTDFIRVYTENPAAKKWLVETAGTAEWPTFNIADAAIVVGVAIYMLGYFFEKDETTGNAGASPLDREDKPPELEDGPTNRGEAGRGGIEGGGTEVKGTEATG